MLRDAALRTDRVPHGGVDDPAVLDCATSANPRHPPGVASVYESSLSAARGFPGDDYCRYRVRAGEYVGCDPQQVVPTAGGLAALRLAIWATVAEGESVVVPYPSFPEYGREVRLQGGDVEPVRWKHVPDVDPAAHALVIAPNPNTPTGAAYDPGTLRDLADRCRAAGTALLVDEAHLGLTDRRSMAGLPGTIVTRSPVLTFGVPGLRAGFAVATDDHRTALENARLAWTVSVPAAEVVAHCMEKTGFLVESRERLADERERVRSLLATEYDVRQSVAPFLLVDVGSRDPGAVVRGARERGVAVRNVSDCRGLDSHVRVAIKSAETNDELVSALLES